MNLFFESNKHLSVKIKHRCEKLKTITLSIPIQLYHKKKGCRFDILSGITYSFYWLIYLF